MPSTQKTFYVFTSTTSHICRPNYNHTHRLHTNALLKKQALKPVAKPTEGLLH